MKILLDMDGVLVDFLGGLLEKRGLKDPYLDPDNLGIYHLETLFDISITELFSGLDRSFWAGLAPTVDMGAILSLCESYGEVCLLSSPTQNIGCMEGKLDWIKKWIPEYSRRCLFGGLKDFCAGPGHVLVDDHSKNTERFEAAGGVGILLPGPWNSNHWIPDRVGYLGERLGGLL